MPSLRNIVSLCIALLPAATAAAPAPSVLLERLQADHAALVAAERDYRRSRDKGRLGPAEATDYRHYLARLRERLERDCRDLAGAIGSPLPADLPCPPRPAPAPRVLPVDPSAERTYSEQVSALDAELKADLGEFDEMLLQEQQRLKAARTASARGVGEGTRSAPATGAGAASGAEQTRITPSDAADKGETAEMGAAGVAEPSASPNGQGGAGGPPRPAAKGAPDDIPNGHDDDVVARQLREAAEKEQDPALKKRLWEEYRRYKQGQR